MAQRCSIDRITQVPHSTESTVAKSQTDRHGTGRISVCLCETGDQTMVLLQALRSLQWPIVSIDKRWDVFWTFRFPEAAFCRKMKRYQCINHFSGMHEICRKDLLAKNLISMQKVDPQQYDFFPKSWVFPYDFNVAIDYARTHPNTIYILKPVRGSMGRGIELTRTLKDSMRYERIVCQVYMKDPLLLDGFKFDLRVYVLVASVDPLRVYVYNEGLVRLATRLYEYPLQSNIRDKFMHLTNYSINKNSATYSRDWETGSKRRFASFNRLFAEEGYDVVKLWHDIDDLIIKTILTTLPELQHEYRTLFPGHDRISACFEILGFDIIIDHDLRPFLLEVNQSPSFNNNTHIDDTVKTNLIRDTLNLLNLSAKYRQQVLHEERVRIFGGEGKLRQPKTAVSRSCEETVELGQFRELHLTNYLDLMSKVSVSSFYNDTKISQRRAEYGQQRRQNSMRASNDAKIDDDTPKDIPRTSPMKLKRTLKPIDNQRHFGRRVRLLDKCGYLPTDICERDENRRLRDASKRDYLIRQSGIDEILRSILF